MSDELNRLPMVDERYGLWPWPLRALARRRHCSPGTVHKHHQALSAPGVLVTDDHGRTLVDTVRPDEARAAGRHLSTLPAVAEGADVIVAIEALTSAAEARSELAGVFTH